LVIIIKAAENKFIAMLVISITGFHDVPLKKNHFFNPNPAIAE
jgi:hypothetical protein